jgi:hypothetical protein
MLRLVLAVALLPLAWSSVAADVDAPNALAGAEGPSGRHLSESGSGAGGGETLSASGHYPGQDMAPSGTGPSIDTKAAIFVQRNTPTTDVVSFSTRELPTYEHPQGGGAPNTATRPRHTTYERRRAHGFSRTPPPPYSLLPYSHAQARTRSSLCRERAA